VSEASRSGGLLGPAVSLSVLLVSGGRWSRGLALVSPLRHGELDAGVVRCA